jgi:hypothetical protein
MLSLPLLLLNPLSSLVILRTKCRVPRPRQTSRDLGTAHAAPKHACGRGITLCAFCAGMAGAGVAGGALHMSQSYMQSPMLPGSMGEVGIHLQSSSARQVTLVLNGEHDGGS